MFNVLQNYKFESNSQPSWEADHAVAVMFNVLQNYKFESNSQHLGVVGQHLAGCLTFCKITNLKAIHNPVKANAGFTDDV